MRMATVPGLISSDRKDHGGQGGAPSYMQTGAEHEHQTDGSSDSGVVSVEDVKENDTVIAVMGPTGSGKTTFVHSVSGYEIDDLDDRLKPRTLANEVRAVRFRDQESGHRIVLVDMPGLDDAVKSDLDVLRMISYWLNTSYRKKKLLSGILYLHRITDNRMTGTPLRNLRVFQKLCGKEALDKVYLTMTMWDEVEEEVGERRLEELKSVYWKTMIDHGARLVRCRSDNGSQKSLVQEILKEGGTCRVLLQQEMVDMEKDIKETAAGQQLQSQTEDDVQNQTWHDTQSLIGDEMRSQAGDQTRDREAVSEEHDPEAEGFSSVDKAEILQEVDPKSVMTLSRSGRIMSLLSRTKLGRHDRYQGGRSSYQLPGAEQEFQIDESLGPLSIGDLKERDIVIAIMGPTGSGKSTFVHSASGRETQRMGNGLKSTSDVCAIRFRDQESGQFVVLVDTPGFDDTYKSDLDILSMISEWLSSSYKQGKLLSAILYFHRITDSRMAGTSQKNLRVFRKLCGDDALEKVYFTTTMWDEVTEGIGKKRLEELKSVYWKKMIDHGAQVFCCGDIDGPPKKLVQKILENAKGRGVLLQIEMVELEREIKETMAGQELYSHLEVLVREQTVVMQRLSEAREAARDPQLVSELEGQLAKLRKQVDDRLRDMQKLKLSVMARFLSNPAKLLRSLFSQAVSFSS